MERRAGQLRIGEVQLPSRLMPRIARPHVMALAPDVEGPVDHAAAGDGPLTFMVMAGP